MSKSYKPGDPYYAHNLEPPWEWVQKWGDNNPDLFVMMLCNAFYVAHHGSYPPSRSEWYCECMAELIKIGHVGPDWPSATIRKRHRVSI